MIRGEQFLLVVKIFCDENSVLRWKHSTRGKKIHFRNENILLVVKFIRRSWSKFISDENSFSRWKHSINDENSFENSLFVVKLVIKENKFYLWWNLISEVKYFCWRWKLISKVISGENWSPRWNYFINGETRSPRWTTF